MIARLPVRLRDSALDDLREIADYIYGASGSAKTAKQYANRLRQRCLNIGNAPRSGRPRDDLVQGLRTIAFERTALICYIVTEDRIWITNIFYGGRDFEAMLRDDETG